jgi:hypothetical protein
LGVAIVLVMRLVVPLSIFRWPFWGALAAIVADTVDILFFQAFGFPHMGYHELDKILDEYYLAIEFIVVQRWPGAPRAIASGLFAYRLAGFVLFEALDNRIILFIFPNVFEFYYLLIAYMRERRDERVLAGASLAVWLPVLLIPKMGQEYVLHYGKLLDHAVALDIIRDVVIDIGHGVRAIVR